ncbi:helix-turn-helix domain-containing protein [Paenisporosarcina indica]
MYNLLFGGLICEITNVSRASLYRKLSEGKQ